MSFVHKADRSIKFALDIKSTYRLENRPDYCNGFTLGSHGEYFKNRKSSKNIQFPYGEYLAHICLGVLYSRAAHLSIEETTIQSLSNLQNISSVLNDIVFFAEEKWKIASDKSGSGNTANIGSITYIPDLISGKGVFSDLGEEVFDEYWINKGILQVPDKKQKGQFKKLTKLEEFLAFKGIKPQKK